MYQFILMVIVISFIVKICMIASVFIKSGKRRLANSNAQKSRLSNTHDYSGDNAAHNAMLLNQMNQEQNRLFQEQMQRDMDTHNNIVMQNQMQRDMDEAARFSMNSSYNAMSDANFACTGIDSFGHNPF